MPSIRVLLVCLLAVVCVAQADDKQQAFQVYVENDSRALKPNHNTDRHYTHGTKLVYLMQPDWQWVDDFSTWHFGDAEQSVDTAIGIFLGQNIYTPNYIDRPELRPEKDRRYAGWLYTGLFAQRATADVLDHFEINLGVIGPSSHAQEAQENVHKWLGGAQPIGWEDQMDDEMAADFVFMRQQRIVDGPLAPTEMADVIAEYGFTAGSVHRHAQAGVVIRYGLGLGKTFVPGRLELPSGVSALREEPKAATYLYGRATVKAIEHNRFLTGLKEEPVMGEFQIGAVYKRGRFEMSYSQTFFTQEFEEQQGVDSIGALTFSLLF